MRLQALRFTERGRPVHSELSVASNDALKAAGSSDGPVAYVVRDRDLEHLRRLDVTVDRGKKNKAKELSKLLLGQKKVPFIRGTYTQPGRLVQGVHDFLIAAADNGERNMYVIGAADTIFEKLWKQIERSRRSPQTKHAATPNDRSGPAAVNLPPQDLLDLLPRSEVPADLEKNFIGVSLEAEVVRQLIMRAAWSPHEVLILGDTGTGKEVVARCIHDYSGRRPFITVNCSAFAADQFDAVLFGQAKRAAPSATEARDGLWKLAESGTLFLDEISELQPQHQAEILRTLETRLIRPVGGDKDISVPAHVIAATNRDLFGLMQAGRFNEDLYYRLRSLTIRLPPLRSRSEDIPLLARKFWREITWDDDATLPKAIMVRLKEYRWPGNARELKAVLCSLHTLFGKDNLTAEQLAVVLEDQDKPVVARSAAERESSLRRVDCLRHLRRVEELIRACQVTLQPLRVKQHAGRNSLDAVHGALHYRLHELSMLCMQPDLFHTEATFDVVNRFKGKLEYFHDLLQHRPAEARRCFHKELAGELKLTLAAICKEVERVMEGA